MFNTRLNLFTEKEQLTEIKEDKDTVIIPVGMLQELNQNLSAGAFIQLSQSSPVENRLTPEKVKSLMPQILAADEKMLSGKATAADFRKEMRGILKLEEKITDQQFDHAWNAMLGNDLILIGKIEELKKLNKNFVLISKTGPIHTKHLLSKDTTGNPLQLSGLPLFVSYHCADYKSAETLYKDAMNTLGLKPENTTIVLQSISTNPFTKIRDEEISKQVAKWAESSGMQVIDREPGEDICKKLERNVFSIKNGR